MDMKLQTVPEIEIDKESETELEPLYRVIIHNDDVTPMDFVVNVLTSIFFLSQPDALEVMYTAHYKPCPNQKQSDASTKPTSPPGSKVIHFIFQLSQSSIDGLIVSRRWRFEVRRLRLHLSLSYKVLIIVL